MGAGLVAVLLGATACAGSSSSNAPKAAASSAGVSDQPVVSHAADDASCLAVKKVFIKLATVSAGWDPRSSPFDSRTAAAFKPVVSQLRAEARTATPVSMRKVVTRNADALSALAHAMKSHQQPKVTAALARSRLEFASLPACARQGVHAKPSAQHSSGVSGGTSSAPPTTQEATIKPAAVKDPGCIAAKAAYLKLGPVTAKWDISTDPFDAAVAQAFRSTAAALDAAAGRAKVAHVAEKAKANAAAFRVVADAMGAKDASKVDDAIITMQQTAVTLATTCPLS